MKWYFWVLIIIVMIVITYRICKLNSVCSLPAPALAIPLTGKINIFGKCINR